MHVLVDRSDVRPVSDVAMGVLPIAVGAKRMKLVISTETERPAGLLGRPGSTAGVAAEAALTGSEVQARKHPLEVLSQFRQPLGELVQRRLGGREALNPRVASFHLDLRFWLNPEPSPRSSRISGRQSETYATGTPVQRAGSAIEQRERPVEGVYGPFPAGSCVAKRLPLAAAAAYHSCPRLSVRSPGADPCHRLRCLTVAADSASFLRLAKPPPISISG